MHLDTIRPVGYPPSPCSVSGKSPRIQYSLVVAACLASCFACGKSAGPDPAGNSIHASPAPAIPQAPPTAPPVPPAIAATPPSLPLPAPVTPTALSVGAIHIDVLPESGKLSPAEAQQIGNGLAEKLRHERTQLLAIGRILTVLDRPGVQLPGQVTAAIRIQCDGEGAVDTSTTVCQGPSIVAGDASPDYPETTVASVVVGWMPSGQLGRFGTTVPPNAAAGAVLLVTVHVSARAAIDFFKGSAPVPNRTPLPLAILGGFAPPPAKRAEITSVEIKVSTREEFDVFLMRGNSGKGFTVSATKCSADGCTIVPKCPENITGCDQGYDLRILGPDQFEIVPQDAQKGPIGPLPAGLYTRTEAASAPVGDTRTPGQIMAGFACCPSPGDETAKNCVQAVPKNCGACQRDLDCMGCECGCPASKCDAGQCTSCPEQTVCTTMPTDGLADAGNGGTPDASPKLSPAQIEWRNLTDQCQIGSRSGVGLKYGSHRDWCDAVVAPSFPPGADPCGMWFWTREPAPGANSVERSLNEKHRDALRKAWKSAPFACKPTLGSAEFRDQVVSHGRLRFFVGLRDYFVNVGGSVRDGSFEPSPLTFDFRVTPQDALDLLKIIQTLPTCDAGEDCLTEHVAGEVVYSLVDYGKIARESSPFGSSDLIDFRYKLAGYRVILEPEPDSTSAHPFPKGAGRYQAGTVLQQKIFR